MLVRVGTTKDVLEMRVFDVAGSWVTLAKASGRLYAFDDTCTQMGCSLAGGELEGTILTCVCCGSRYDITSGAVVSGPARCAVRSRIVRIEGDDLLVEA